MKIFQRLMLLSIVVFYLFSNTSFANEKLLSALDIINSNILAESSIDESTRVEITLQNSHGKTQKRTLSWKSITPKEGNKQTLVYFEFPKFIRGTSLLTVEHKSDEDERWLYLPSIKKTRRISGTEKSDNFFGTDFSYEDLVTEDVLINDYQFKENDPCTSKCFTIVATPSTDKNKQESGYSKRELTIDSTTFLISAVDYFDKSGRKSKTFRAQSFQKINDNGAMRPFKTTMKDLINDHLTIMNFTEYAINTGIKPSEVSRRALTKRR